MDQTILAGRKIFIYAGNMGIAQGTQTLIDLAEIFKDQLDVGFLLVGRGSDFKKLSANARSRGLKNIVFHDEINPDEIPGLYAQCKVGLIVLDPRHKSHNIPGKFLTYMQSGLPVLAFINPRNDLVGMIENHKIGCVSVARDLNSIRIIAFEILKLIDVDKAINNRCRSFYLNHFSPDKAVRKIVSALGFREA
jgi:glycosyltransferase involved in cell wall biosynthesis